MKYTIYVNNRFTTHSENIQYQSESERKVPGIGTNVKREIHKKWTSGVLLGYHLDDLDGGSGRISGLCWYLAQQELEVEWITSFSGRNGLPEHESVSTM